MTERLPEQFSFHTLFLVITKMEDRALSCVGAYEVFERVREAREALNNAGVPEKDRIVYDPYAESLNNAIEEGRKDAKQECWDAVHSFILNDNFKGEDLYNSGIRNGLVLALNAIAKLME